MANNSTAIPVTFVPAISQEVPWHTRQHLQLLYQKLANHTAAFATLAKTAAGTVNNTTIQNIAEGGSGGGGAGMIPGLGGMNDQTGNTTYTTTNSDNGVVLILNDAAPVAVTLNSGVSSPWMMFATNEGAGLVTFTPTTGTINGGATFTLPFNYTTLFVFDGTNWIATSSPVVPQNTPAITHEWINAYNSVTGAFTQSQPTVSDVSGAAPIASPTFTGTVTQPTPSVLTAAVTDTSASAGAASALPSNPLGYLEMSINGVTVKVPFYSV